MTLKQLVGQLFWCGWGRGQDRPAAHNDHCRYLVQEMNAGGLILFDHNLQNPCQVAALTAEIGEKALRRPLIGIDQEGGRICRLALPGLIFPGNMALGTLDEARTREVSRAIGEQLAAMGVGVDFAPVLDVNNNPDNPVIGVRSFGEDPERVARCGVASVAGFRDAGILPVLKHFPGHGDTTADSHFALPVQPAGRARLDAVELWPFREALASGYPVGVMTTHILFPALDPERPATLSRPILTGLLREEMGFDGLIVTDCLEMRAIADHWAPEEIGVMALQAGADMLLVCHTREVQTRMHAGVCEAVRAGRLTEERILSSVHRIDEARALAPASAVPGDPSIVGSAPYRELEACTARDCVQVIGSGRKRSGFRKDRPVVVTGAEGVSARLAAVLREEGFTAEAAEWPEAGLERLRDAPQLVWAALPREPFQDGRPPAEVASLLAEHPHAVIVAFREPYCLDHYPARTLRVAAWEGRPPHLRAVAQWLGSCCDARSRRAAA